LHFQGVRGVWFHVGLADTEWVPVLAENGFVFHHARSDRVAMVKWLPKDISCAIPPYAHHMVGVGGMVVNDKDEILCVQEKYASMKLWKLPGGNLVLDFGLHCILFNTLSFQVMSIPGKICLRLP
jgi:hypothetical protein